MPHRRPPTQPVGGLTQGGIGQLGAGLIVGAQHDQLVPGVAHDDSVPGIDGFGQVGAAAAERGKIAALQPLGCPLRLRGPERALGRCPPRAGMPGNDDQAAVDLFESLERQVRNALAALQGVEELRERRGHDRLILDVQDEPARGPGLLGDLQC